MRSKPGDELTVRHQSPAESILELRQLTKRFGDFAAVDCITLRVAAGEFLTLLGASGSGKTTTLRMIAGFEQPSSGDILMEGSPITALPPYQRDINTVFQHYALFPHMSVRDNIEYGLRMRRVSAADREQRIREALRMVRLDDLGARSPRQLSGGQQQRVALARALVNQPRVLLLDEPLGALDLKLRKAMQLELKQLQSTLGITFLYVTHDQEEALTMSDRIVLLRQGTIEQVGSPRDLYDRPASRYVADFIGETNLLEGVVVEGGPGPVLLRRGERLLAGWSDAEVPVGRAAWLSLRPEAICLYSDGGAVENVVEGTVTELVYLGSLVRVHLSWGDGDRLVFHADAAAAVEAGTKVRVGWSRRAARCVTD
jgi:spermidine/putrescine transport system ATP-binding protein